MHPAVQILFIGFLYVLLFGGYTLLRRERLSSQFAIEALLLTGLGGGLVYLTGIALHPVLFLVLLYVVTMRARWLVDMANIFAQRGDFRRAGSLYNLARKLLPDATSLLIIVLNEATALLQAGHPEEAVTLFERVIAEREGGYLGVKYEAAAHYNLAVAHLRENRTTLAIKEFNTTIDIWPGSEYARRADRALEKMRSRKS